MFELNFSLTKVSTIFMSIYIIINIYNKTITSFKFIKQFNFENINIYNENK